MEQAKKVLSDRLGGKLKIVEPLAPYNELKLGGPADFFIEAKSEDDLINAVEAARAAKVPYFVLGLGTSIVVSDAGYHGLVIKNSYEGIKESPTDTKIKVEVEVSSGTSLAKLVRFSVDNNFSGLEGLAGQPGTVGGALVWNTGEPSTPISEAVELIKIIDVVGSVREIGRHEAQFGKATSRFLGRSEVILSVKFHLIRSDSGTVGQNVRIAMEKRSDVAKEPQAIEAFLHVEGQSPERILAAAGLAGFSVGGIKFLESHANQLKNTGNGTSENVADLIKTAQEKVRVKYYTDLKEAFTYLGP